MTSILRSPILRTLNAIHCHPHPLPLPLASKYTFSIATRARTLVRSFKFHPFGRLPKTQTAQKGDWKKQARRLGDAAMFYFPFMGVVLAWPLAAEWVLDGRMN